MRQALFLGEDDATPRLIESSSGNQWRFHRATTCDSAINAISNNCFYVGLIQLNHPAANNLPALTNVILSNAEMEWIVALPSAALNSVACCQFISENCFDYHTLPIDERRLANSLGHAYGKAQLKRKGAPEQSSISSTLLGQSAVMQRLYRQILKIRSADSPVLICGESGTGKELVANLIHQNSARANAPFVAVNCGALPSNLIQSELFGHEKGSFTGASERKQGKIEAAQRGTIFLDEIGDLPLNLQTNLLRFLQEKTIERIGSNRSLLIDARVIAATNIDLEKAVKQGHFREDVYYRLNVLNLKLPPLREREGDIELMAKAFLERFSRQNNRRLKGFTRHAIRQLNNHSWPGNVRELINRIQRAVIMSEKQLISPQDLGLERRKTDRSTQTLDQARHSAEFETIRNSLFNNGNNISATAKQLGVSRATLYRLMEKLDISIDN